MIDFTQEKIHSLINAYPYFMNKNIHTKISDEEFVLAFPNKDSYFSNIKEDILFNNKTYKDLEAEMEIPDFKELINKHKLIVAEQFINSKNNGHALFNGKKFGIQNILINKVNNQYVIEIEFYKTDYYTHKVMKSIYNELIKHNDKITYFTCVEDIIKYYPFLTSFGTNTLLIMKEANEQSLVLTKRSKHMSNMTRDQWHISTSEGLDLNDVNNKNPKEISLAKCALRGIWEELGLKEEIISNQFCNIFINRNNFEVGIFSIAKTNISREYFDLCYKHALDSIIETKGYKIIPYNSFNIEEIIKEKDLTDIAKYCLLIILKGDYI